MGQFEAFIGVNFWTALFTLLNTTVLCVVLGKFLFKPVKNMIDSRQKEIDELYTKAQDAKVLAEQQQAEYAQKLESAYAAGEQIVKEAVARGQSREEEILRKANREAAAILDKATADIAREKQKAVSEAKNEISDMALEIAGKVVGKSLNDADQAKLVDSFIAELGEQP